jgi:S1-C subfamily serine protease
MGSFTEIVEQTSTAVALVECADIGSRGSAFVVGADGQLATNAHVVAKPLIRSGFLSVQYSSDIMVRIAGATYSARLLTDPTEPRPIVYDYALLKVDGASDLVPLDVADAAVVRPGDEIVCLGYPLDFEAVVATHGIASAIIHRPSHWNSLHRMRTIVTDALIQFGNSGGPMVHVDTGAVVGINTLKHELRDALSRQLRVWLESSAIIGFPALRDLIEYTLRFTHVGLNHAVSAEYVAADPAWAT